MKIVLQRVSYGSVSVNNQVVGEIGRGLVLLVGITQKDNKTNADFLVEKSLNLRIFEDSDGKMNLSLLDIKGELLIISQFTLYGDTRKGRRPSFVEAAPPAQAEEIYDYFVEKIKKSELKVETGIFRENMLVKIHNDGPVTFILEN
jgi:D-tyrosyl-tRNA(Tyr) deacylase